MPNGNHLRVSRHIGGERAVASFGCGVVGPVAGLVDYLVEAGLGGGVVNVEHPGGGVEVVALVAWVVDCY